MRIRNDWDYLIHLLSCAVGDAQPQEKPAHISFEKVLEYGITHEVANYAYLSVLKLRTPPEKEIMKQWQDFYYGAIRRDVLQAKMRQEILTALHGLGIPTVEVQGTYVKGFYPAPDLRMMSDIDVIVPRERLREAGNALVEKGYRVVQQRDVDMNLDSPAGLQVELHTDFFTPGNLVYPAMHGAFEVAAIDREGNGSVTDTVFLLYHLLHCLKHYYSKGVGIRRIMDIHVLRRALGDRVDWAYIHGVLDENGFKTGREELFALADVWFCGKPMERRLESVAREVYKSGLHGETGVALKNDLWLRRRDGERFVRVKYFFEKIFPPKQWIYDGYPELKEREYPLAICWIYRWRQLLTQKEKREMFAATFHSFRWKE